MNIVVIGMSGRYPGADNLRELHKVLVNKEDKITTVSDKRRELLKLDTDKDYQEIGFLEDIQCFDPGFFHIAPREAVNMSPEQRISLELAAQAILDGGYSLSGFQGTSCGVFVASQDNDYYSMLENKSGLSWIGSMKSMIAGRIAYTLDLHGPNVVMDTGCSSVLVGLDDACMRLETHDIDYALVGGVTVYLKFGTKNTDGDLLGIEAGNGRCKPFDAKADGIGVGEGGGFVLLKREEDARRDKDYIYGIIRAASLSGDGIRCSSMTTPGIEGQKEAILNAWKKSGEDIEHMTELEAHGTGTRLGDPIEVESFEESYRELHGSKGKTIYLGSVKGNLGHLNANAGIASLEKVLLGFEHNLCYPICGYEEPNPFIEFDKGVLTPVDKVVKFESSDRRIAGINSFGLSGTNAHVILENNTEKAQLKSIDETMLLKLSAKSEASLQAYILEVKSYIKENGVSKNLLGTLNVGRDDYAYRAIVSGISSEDFIKSLDSVDIVALDKKSLGKKSPSFSTTGDEEEKRNLITTLYLDGYDIDWKKYVGEYEKLPAPNYHFDKQEFWGEMISEAENKKTEGTIDDKKSEGVEESKNTDTAMDVEEKLKDIWADVLECELDEIEEDTDFFDLGGNSLLITILVEDIKTAFGVDIPVDDIYEYGTVQQQADIIRENTKKTDSNIELLPMQQLVLNSVKAEKGSSKWNLNVSFKLEGILDVKKLSDAFVKVCKNHEILASRIVSDKGKDYIEPVEAITQNLVSVIQAAEERELKQALDKEALRGIDVFTESMTRLFIYVVDEKNAYLLLKISHIIADGWTLNLVFEELCKAYADGGKSMTPEESFHSYVPMETDLINKIYAESDIRPLVKESKKYLKTPKYNNVEKCSPPEYVIVGTDRFDRLKAFAKDHKFSLFQITLAVYHKTIQEYLGVNHSSVAIMQANRGSKAYRNTAGLFARAVLVDVDASDTEEMLSRVKDRTGLLMKHQAISLGDEIQKQQNKFEDFVDFMLTYQNFNNGDMELEGIRFLPNMISGSEAVCPMTILFYDTQNYLMGTLQYSPEYFSKDEVKEFVAIYQKNVDELINSKE